MLTIQKETNKNLMERHGVRQSMEGIISHLELAINSALGFLGAKTEGITIYN